MEDGAVFDGLLKGKCWGSVLYGGFRYGRVVLLACRCFQACCAPWLGDMGDFWACPLRKVPDGLYGGIWYR